MNRGNSVSKIISLWVGQLGFDSHHGKGLFATASRPALQPTQPPIQWVPWSLSLGIKLTTYLHLLPRLRKHRAIPPLLHTSARHRDNYIFTCHRHLLPQRNYVCSDKEATYFRTIYVTYNLKRTSVKYWNIITYKRKVKVSVS
jgi:hypothetical protein